ncbi:MAG TPA: Hsp20/alpha crystallin family protein [Verrucomicrobiae bacterium]|nr:Hsp20/alpha crystallin family protein [Verrucomicrobiae bacterium]
MGNRVVAEREENAPAREETRSGENYIRPAVDILETEHGLTIIADLAGVQKEKVEVQIDKGILTIQGEGTPTAAGSELYHEFSVMNYYRQFQIPEAIDQEKTTAEYTDGVLTLQLYKAEHAKPRRIQVSTS